MKVLLVSHTYALAINRAKLHRLSRTGIDLHALVPSNWRTRDLFKESMFGLNDSGGPDFRLSARPVWRPGHSASYLFSFRTAVDLIREFRPDLIHIENEAYSFVAAQFVTAGRVLGIKTSLFGWENVEWPVHPTQILSRRLTLRYANGIISGSAGARKLIEKWGYTGPATVMPQLGVDPNLFAPPSSFDRGNVLRIGFVGRLVPEKGCDLLLRAIRQLTNAGIEARCILCGDGPAEPSLARLAQDLGLGSRVSFLKDVLPEDVPSVMREVDIFVLPSRRTPTWAEQFGHVLIEAMCCGCVVVGAQSGAIPEVIGCPGVIFEENNADDLTRILTRLAADSDERASLRAFFQKRVQENYTHEVIASSLASFWERVLSGNDNSSLSDNAPLYDAAKIG